MTQSEAVERLARWLYPSNAEGEARAWYLRMLSEQTAALASILVADEKGTAEFAVKQVHAIIEMLEV